MEERKREQLVLYLRVINSVVSVLLLSGVFLAYDTLDRDHDQRRRVYTMHLYDEWRRVLDFGDARRTLELVREGVLEDNELESIARGEEFTVVGGEKAGLPKDDVSADDAIQMRQHIVSILNLFEQVAVARRDHVGDEQMIDSYFKEVVTANRERLKPFVDTWSSKDREGWRPLDRVIDEEWSDARNGLRNL